MAPGQANLNATSNAHRQQHHCPINDHSHPSAASTTSGPNQTLSSDEHVEDDRRILHEYKWELYKVLPPAMQEAIEANLLMRLLLKSGNVSNDACAICLKTQDNIRALLLEGWEKGTFQALRGNLGFISLGNATVHDEDRTIHHSSPDECMDDVRPEGFADNDNTVTQSKESDRRTLKKPSHQTSGQADGVDDGCHYELVNAILESNDVAKLNISSSTFVAGHDINVAVNVWEVARTSGQKHQIAEWFFNIDYRAMHNEVAKKRLEGTGLWFLRSKAYGSWCASSEQRLMWCPGIPGVGKTVMASLVVDHLRMLDESCVFVGVIYFNYKLRNQQSRLAILEAICRQMFEIHEDAVLKRLYDSHERRKSRPKEDELRSALSDAFRDYQSCYLVLDALDEYTADYSDKQVRDLIGDMLSFGKNVKLLVTSRALGEMEATFKELEASREEIVVDDADMRTYVGGRVDSLKSKFDFTVSDGFSQHIIEKVAEAAKGRFLAAELGMNLLGEQLNLGDLEDALENLPHGIDETYVRILEFLRNHTPNRREIAMKALMWVAYACRPLSVRELQHAVATKHGRKETDKYVTPLSTLTGLCAGLIVAQEKAWEGQPDDQRGIRFVHFTTQEFFERSQPEYFLDAHREMFSTCVEYLSITGNHTLRADFAWADINYSWKQRVHLPFYDYAALYWGQHANTHHEPLLPEIVEILHRNDRPVRLSWEYTLRQIMSDHEGTSEIEKDSCGLFLAAYHDQPKTLSALLDCTNDIPCIVEQRTLIHVAALAGRVNILKEMLQWSNRSHNDRDPTVTHDSIQLIAKNKYRDHILFHQHARDRHGRTPFSYAAEAGKEPVIKLLLEYGGVEVDSKDGSGRTPFSYAAAQQGGDSILKLLLEHGGVEVDSKDDNGQTPLSYAAQRGNNPTVELLMKRGVEADSKDNEGRTPLSHTAQWGHESMVKLLLEHGGVEADSKDNEGRTPFSYAAGNGMASVIAFLLARGGVEMDSKDNSGRTPLSHAAQWGEEATVKLLLKHGGVEADSNDNTARTPLSYAAEWGRKSTVKRLLEYGSVEADLKDDEGRTPFSYAAGDGRESVITFLLARGGVEVDSKDNKGRTPLSHAAERGRESTVKLLLGHGGVDANLKDDKGRTPLSYAAGNGMESVIAVLLAHGGAEMDSRDNAGRTPLSHAAERGSESTVKLLLMNEGVEADSKDNKGRTPFSYAARLGRESTVKLLLDYEGGQVDISSVDNEGKTALYHANSWICYLLFHDDIRRDDLSGDFYRVWLDATQRVADLLVAYGVIEFPDLYGEEV